ncbi:hypothetical protein GCM10022204_28470 [Microlunatus aurantiacus]|uniref:Uncharacterized protein n=1 Tax=Microlunatus aurantiacus TaxID=446786 RepID=A0ABP7DSY3_9ACTN
MALARRFNPPPNWPAAPDGWVPPPGWQPDPAWGPPPPDWPVWVGYRANPRAFAWSFGFAGGFYLLILVVALIGTGGDLNPETAGVVLFPFLMAGLVTGLIAWSRPRRWGVWLYPLVVFGIALLVSVISNLGRASGS